MPPDIAFWLGVVLGGAFASCFWLLVIGLTKGGSDA